MANNIALAQAYLKDAVGLNEVAKKALLTGALEANSVQFLGANTVKLPKITFGAGGLGTYSRATGFGAKDINLAWDTYTLTQDNGDSLKLDAMDDEEGLGAQLVPYVNQYIRTIEVPAIDKYRLEVLADGAGVKSDATTITAENAVTTFLEGFESLEENEFNSEEAILFVTPAIDTLFQSSPELTKYIRLDEKLENEVSTKIRRFNGAEIVVVPSSRFPEDHNFLLVHPTAQLSVVKHRPAHYYAPGQVAGFDGAQVDIRLYHDTFVLTERANGIYASRTTV